MFDSGAIEALSLRVCRIGICLRLKNHWNRHMALGSRDAFGRKALDSVQGHRLLYRMGICRRLRNSWLSAHDLRFNLP